MKTFEFMAGIVGAFLSQGAEPFRAAVAGAWRILRSQISATLTVEESAALSEKCGDPERPLGQFKCLACGATWDGSALLFDPQNPRWTCGDACCIGSVQKVSDTPNPQ